jgi:hypothetical protein
MDFSKKLIFVFLFLCISNVAYSVCITKKTRIDVNCSCRKTKSCLKFDSKNYKRQEKNAKKAAGKNASKIYKKTKHAIKGADSIFDGTINPRKLDIKKFQKIDNQLTKVNKKMIKRLEKRYKAAGMKHSSFNKLKKYIDKTMDKAVPKHVQNYVEKYGIPTGAIKESFGLSTSALGSNFGSSPDKSVEAIRNISQGKPAEMDAGPQAIDPNLSKEEKERLLAQRKADEFRKGKKYKFNDIHPNHVSLFKVISLRYLSIKGRLDQKAIMRDTLRIDKKGVRRQLSNMIEKLF